LELLEACLSIAVWELVEDLSSVFVVHVSEVSVGISSDSSGQLHVLLHEGHTLGVDRTQVSILENTGEVCFGGFLKGNESLRLEAELSVDVTADLAHESVEGSSWKEVAGLLLIAFDLTEGDGTWSEPVLFPGLFDSTISWSSLLVQLQRLVLGCLGSELGGRGELAGLLLNLGWLGKSFGLVDFLGSGFLLWHLIVED